MRDRIRAQMPVLVTAALAAALTAGGPALATAAFDARNADRVDGRHAVGAAASPGQRGGKLVATSRAGYLPGDIIKRAPNSARLGGRGPSAYTTHWINVNPDGSIRSHSAGLGGATVTKIEGVTGRYCLTVPDSVRTEAVVGTMQEIFGGANEYVIAVTTTFGNACNSVGPWDIAVHTRMNGAPADGSFMLLIPGTPQG